MKREGKDDESFAGESSISTGGCRRMSAIGEKRRRRKRALLVFFLVVVAFLSQSPDKKGLNIKEGWSGVDIASLSPVDGTYGGRSALVAEYTRSLSLSPARCISGKIWQCGSK